MSDDPTRINERQPKVRGRRLAERRHHRRWWDFNVIPLALGLFPLVYVRHLWNVGQPTILSLVALVFLTWMFVGWVGRLHRFQKDGLQHGLVAGMLISIFVLWRILRFSLIALLGLILISAVLAWAEQRRGRK